jgi:2-C-methyl-D-erythritol 2,4-cyclodiphosphate synthase
VTATARPPESLPPAAQPGARDDAGSGLRIGQGYDVHALVPGRPLIIGGVHIDYPRGLLGHSDADVLLHAITDAILGAAGLGDIGQLFPDSDPALSGADSSILLQEAMRLAGERGYRIGNIDATIIAQEPKLARHLPAMIAKIAQALSCEAGQVNLKAKTNEGLGYLGRAEGIEAQAVVLLAVPAVAGATPVAVTTGLAGAD